MMLAFAVEPAAWVGTATAQVAEAGGLDTPNDEVDGAKPGNEVADTVIAAARRGDHQAFTALVSHYDDRLRALAFRLLHDPEATRDALQDAYVKAYVGLSGFRGESEVGTWLHRIVYTTCLNHLRSTARRPRGRQMRCRTRTTGATEAGRDPADTVASALDLGRFSNPCRPSSGRRSSWSTRSAWATRQTADPRSSAGHGGVARDERAREAPSRARRPRRADDLGRWDGGVMSDDRDLQLGDAINALPVPPRDDEFMTDLERRLEVADAERAPAGADVAGHPLNRWFARGRRQWVLVAAVAAAIVLGLALFGPATASRRTASAPSPPQRRRSSAAHSPRPAVGAPCAA